MSKQKKRLNEDNQRIRPVQCGVGCSDALSVWGCLACDCSFA